MRSDRLFSILLILSNKGRLTGRELAEHFEVSVRTIYRDLDKISEAGIPIAAVGGKAGGFYIMDNYSLDDLYLNKEEHHTLMAVLDSLNVIFGKNKQFNDIALKFQNVYKKKHDNNQQLNINMSHISMEDELKEYVFIINKGIEESKLMIFHYINRNMEFSERCVEPIRIEYIRGQWYLTGYCRNRKDYRKFKLVRIKNLRLGDGFLKKNISAGELEEIFHKSYESKDIKIRLKFTNKIGKQLTEYFLKSNIKKSEAGDFIVEEHFPYEEGLIKFILGFGNECEVISPEYLREDTKKYLKKILEKYND
jgi:predicted DNA-binding transcriptional regulator YafY